MLLNGIVFSKDRAMQLDLLLESVLLNFNVDDYKLNILYKSSNDEFQKGYDLVINKYPQFFFKKEENFKDDLLSLFNDSEYTTFFTDDDIIYNKLTLNKDELHNIFEATKCICFSLRLGLNTNICYTQRKINVLNNYKTVDFIHDISLIEPIISWKISDGTNDYAYPMSLDGHIFKTDIIKGASEFLQPTNPNIFEAMLTNFATKDMTMASYGKNKLVNNPINRVQNTFENLAGLIYNYSAEELNEMYLDYVSFDIEKMNFNDVKGCHQEITPYFNING